MWALCKVYFDLCCFNAGPEQLPFSKTVTWVLLILNVALNSAIIQHNIEINREVIEQATHVPASDYWLWILFVIGVSFLLVAGILYSLLKVTKKENRFVLFSAILGADLFFSAILELLVVVGGGGAERIYLTFLIMVWSLAVYASIFAKGFSVSIMQALIYTIGIQFVTTAWIALMVYNITT